MRNAQSFRILVFLLLLLTILGISGPHLVHKLVPVITHPVTLPHWPSVFASFLKLIKQNVTKNSSVLNSFPRVEILHFSLIWNGVRLDQTSDLSRIISVLRERGRFTPLL